MSGRRVGPVDQRLFNERLECPRPVVATEARWRSDSCAGEAVRFDRKLGVDVPAMGNTSARPGALMSAPAQVSGS